MALNAFQQLLTAVGTQLQVALGHVLGSLQITPAPGVAKRPKPGQQITTAQAVDHHQQVHRQRQQAIGHRFQHQQQQRQQRHRQQHQQDQNQPRLLAQARARLQLGQFTQPAAVTLQSLAHGRELLDPHRQHQYQKTHRACPPSCRALRKRVQSKAGPGSVLRPGAISL